MSVWTSLACCCVLGGHVEAAVPVTAAPENAHACCQSAPADDADQAPAPTQQHHDCSCGGHDRLAEPIATPHLVGSSAPLTPPLDFSPIALLSADIEPAAAYSLAMTWLRLRQPPCAQSLVDQHCQLTT